MRHLFRAFAVTLLTIAALFAAAAPAVSITGGTEDTANKYSNVGMVVFYQPDGRFRCPACRGGSGFDPLYNLGDGLDGLCVQPELSLACPAGVAAHAGRIEGLCEPGCVGLAREGTVDLRKTAAPIDGHRILTCQCETLGELREQRKTVSHRRGRHVLLGDDASDQMRGWVALDESRPGQLRHTGTKPYGPSVPAQEAPTQSINSR